MIGRSETNKWLPDKALYEMFLLYVNESRKKPKNKTKQNKKKRYNKHLLLDLCIGH